MSPFPEPDAQDGAPPETPAAARFFTMFKAFSVIQPGWIGPHHAPGITLGERVRDGERCPEEPSPYNTVRERPGARRKLQLRCGRPSPPSDPQILFHPHLPVRGQ